MNSPSQDHDPTAGDAHEAVRPATGPVRVQLRRTRGWRMPPNTLKVDRTTKWGNPFVVGKPGGVYSAKVTSLRHAWQLYRSIAFDNEALVAAARSELRGKNLACWCPHPEPYEHDCCHAAVLLEIANRPPADGAALRQDETDASPREGDSRSEGMDT